MSAQEVVLGDGHPTRITHWIPQKPRAQRQQPIAYPNSTEILSSAPGCYHVKGNRLHKASTDLFVLVIGGTGPDGRHVISQARIGIWGPCPKVNALPRVAGGLSCGLLGTGVCCVCRYMSTIHKIHMRWHRSVVLEEEVDNDDDDMVLNVDDAIRQLEATDNFAEPVAEVAVDGAAPEVAAAHVKYTFMSACAGQGRVHRTAKHKTPARYPRTAPKDHSGAQQLAALVVRQSQG